MEKKVEKYQVSFLDNGNEIAHITFPELTQGFVNINHTYVNPNYRGEGLASKLMEEVVFIMEQNHWRCIATCSYAKNWFIKHPEKEYLLEKEATGCK